MFKSTLNYLITIYNIHTNIRGAGGFYPSDIRYKFRPMKNQRQFDISKSFVKIRFFQENYRLVMSCLVNILIHDVTTFAISVKSRL